MATTSLWAVRGTIRDVVAYVKDPNKTANPDYDLKNVLTYAADNDKTEKQYYVTGLNCSPYFAFERMTATKERYGKRGGIVGYHGYQSFKPGELTPEECHKIGVLTAKRMWGDRFEVIVSTHVKGSTALHNHFVINSVSFKNGNKYRWQKGSYRQLHRVSDELCRQHQLSIIENPMPKKVPRQIWIAEKQGKFTHASILRHDIDRAIRSNISFKYFLQSLEYLGYVVVRNGDYKHISVITEGWSKPVRIDSLGANYTLEAIERRIRDNLHKEPVPRIRKPQRRVACELEKQMKALERYSTIEILFMIFFELMGIPYDDPFTKEQRMRRGEMLGLQWDDLNFRTGELHVCRQVCAVDGKLEISVPKTKSSVRTIVLPPSLVAVLKEYKKTVDSRWMFPSPQNPDSPRYPTGTSDILGRLLRRAGCKRVRFHDLRHTFATMALENGMDVKTLSATIGHVSAATTLDIYSHMTDTMQMQAAVNIDRKIGGTDAQMPEVKQTPKQNANTPVNATYEPTEPHPEPVPRKIRKSGTGCVYQINDHLWEGSFYPRLPNGKRKKFNVYAETREQCEVKLAEMIAEKKTEIKEEKAKRKEGAE